MKKNEKPKESKKMSRIERLTKMKECCEAKAKIQDSDHNQDFLKYINDQIAKLIP